MQRSLFSFGKLCLTASFCLALAGALPALLPAQPSPLPTKYSSTGTYKDSVGTAHAWQITPAHTLLWDNAPYLPVGGAFTPHSLAGESDAAWQEDVGALETLKAHGVRDILISPDNALPDLSVTALQRLINYLDANDFRYGLGFGKGMARPLVGMVIRPTIYRYFDANGLTATWQVSNTDSGLFALVEADNANKLVRADYVTVNSPVITLPMEVPASVVGRIFAQFYPHKAQTGDNTLPDLWGGFDDYRDRLLGFLGKIKFGKGFRFFLDPLARHLGLSGETDYTIPDSPAFRLEWEGFLTQRYGGVDRAREAWSMAEGEFKTLRDMAFLVPLWEKTHGIPYYFNTATGQKLRIVDAGRSRWWPDYLEYRDAAIQYYMNSMADILKQQVANVPVVYTWTQTHPMFLNREKAGGFDGLSIPARGNGDALLKRILVPAYSHVEQADRTLWCIASEIADTNPAAKPPTPSGTGTVLTGDVQGTQTSSQPSGGFTSSLLLSQSLENLRHVGVKGFFVGNLQSGPTGADGDWLRAPTSLDWIRDYSARVGSDGFAARYAPRVLFYPQSSPGPARPGPVPGSNALWLNSYLPGEPTDGWPSYAGYRIQYSVGSLETVLVSLQGRRETHIWVTDPKTIQAFTPDGAPVPFKIIGKTEIMIPLDSTPTIFHAGDQHLVLQEPADDIIIQLDALYSIAQARKIPETESIRNMIDNVRKAYANKDFANAYVLALGKLNELTALVQPYIWIEGERPTSVNTFDEIARNPETSGEYFLTLANHNAPPTKYGKDGYGVYYDIEVPKEGLYNLWLAGSLPGPNVSPIVWRMDMPPDLNIADPNPHGPRYFGDRFGWMHLGGMPLTQGRHRLAIFVPERAVSPAIYNFSIDAIMITQGAFQPNGSLRPPPVDAATLRTLKPVKSGKKQK